MRSLYEFVIAYHVRARDAREFSYRRWVSRNSQLSEQSVHILFSTLVQCLPHLIAVNLRTIAG